MEITSNKRIAQNTLMLYIRMIFVMAVSLYTSRLVLDILGVEDYGLYSVIGGIVALFAVINGALSSGTSRFITFELGKGNIERLSKTFSASFTIHSLIALIVLLLAETIGLWYVNNILVIPEGRLWVANWLYQFSILTSILSLTQVPYSASIIAHEKMNVYAYVGITEAIFKLLMVVFLSYIVNFDKLLFYGAILCLWNICLQLFYRFYCKRHFVECNLIIVKDKSYYKSMLSFSLWDLIGSMCGTGNSQGINLLINFFFGVTVNAARGIAMQVEMALTQFSNNFTLAVGPQITKLYSVGDTDKMMSLVKESSKYAFLLLATVSLPVFQKAEYILEIWLKEVPEYTVIFLRLLIICYLIRGFARPVVHAVHASGNIKWLNLYSGLTSISLIVPLSYISYLNGLPPYFCYIISAVVYIICNYLELIVLKREVNFSITDYTFNVYMRAGIISIIAYIIMYIVDSLLKIHPFIRLIIVCITCVIIMSLVTYIIGLNAEGRKKVISFIKAKLNSN